MPGSFLFYDFETDGQNPMFCRPVQFACIRTDLELNPIDGDTGTISWCRPPVDRLPAPEACLVTGVTPQQAEARGQTECSFFAEINKQMNQAGTISVGWNSLRFDDMICRFGFWRNFHDPYEHGFRNDCRAWDLIDLARAAQALRPEGITWPSGKNGAPTFKLDQLAPANGIDHADAHDALADVRATIDFARILRNSQPKLWNWAMKLVETDAVEKWLNSNEPLVHVSPKLPATQGCLSPFRVLARNPLDKRGFIGWDLRHDPSDLLEADVEEIQRRVFTRQSELPDGETRFPLKQIKSNRSPFVAPTSVLEGADLDRLQLDDQQWQRNDQKLMNCESTLEEVRSKLRLVFGTTPPSASEAEAALYEGFLDRKDQGLRNKVHKAQPKELARIGDQFDDPRLIDLMFRYRGINYPETLDAIEHQAWDKRCQERMMDPPGPHDRPWADWLKHVQTLQSDTERSDRDKKILAEVEAWGLDLAERYELGTSNRSG
ncbi:MAG: exodeoxyribonuclease I [Phycisphaerales bacterium]|nr:exodeoxyribonuclease I [Phycisphaerales bacterium]